MQSLALTASWPVTTVAAAVVLPDGAIATIGPDDHEFRLASISKMMVGWAALVACEEGTIGLDEPAGQPGCTIRHLLAHAGGYPFAGGDPIAKPATRRIYSNTGVELVAETIAMAAGMPFGRYLAEAVFDPLGMTATRLDGSPAHGVRSTIADVLRFVHELRSPTLLAGSTAAEFATAQFASLAGVVPGIGRFDPCPWGLAAEIRGAKQPHWTGTRNSPGTYGHFGGAGTLLWVDPGAHVACIALTDRPFDEWSAEALRLWPQLADAILIEAAS